jgi:DNA primase catalytic core
MSLHKLNAGDGYTYLTRQVATVDSTELGYSSLGDYYAAKGESPGVWIGTQAVEMGLAGTTVTEQQMKNLFGEGLHPDAQRLEAEALAALPAKGSKRDKQRAVDRAGKLGAKFPVFEASPMWHEKLAAAYQKYNEDHGLAKGDKVPEAQKQPIRTEVGTAMFTAEYGRDPHHEPELAGFIARQSRPERSAVAGFDLTFSPVKSVSTLWAVAPPEVAAKIEAAHQAAVNGTLEWLEKEAGYTREGTGSVSQIRIKGFLATAFTHRDSRAGDPDLHTHVAVSNKVQTPDGRWLALDARMLYRYNVPASEEYNLLLESEITQRLGGKFAERGDAGEGKREIRELVGVPAALNEHFSSRAVMIDARRAELIAAFQADHGRVPTTIERIQLSQTATLATRQAKHEPMSLAQQRQLWQAYPDDICSDSPAEIVAEVLGHTGDYADVTPDLIAELSSKVVQVVSGDRAQWRENNLSAEARRQAKAAGVHPASTADLATVLTEAATGIDLSIPIGMDTEIDQPIPAALLDVDGKAVFRVAKGQLYTSPAILAAESRIVAAAGQADAWALTDTDVELAHLEWSANNQGRTLNTGQEAMVRQVATSGRRMQLMFGPAGTGKTTSLAVLTLAAQSRGITVLGLAPQASAAQELAAAVPGITSDTLHKLVWELTQGDPNWVPEDSISGSTSPAAEVQWITDIGPQSLVIIDEAGLAGTKELDVAVRYITSVGGRVLLVGDDRQRAANGAGGVLRDIESSHGALMLDEVMRFTDRGVVGAGALHGRATLALRAGDPGSIGYYADRNLIRPVTPDTVTEQVFAGWRADIAAGADSIMIAPTLDMVSDLNGRARAARLATAGGESGVERDLLRGEKVSAGDLIVTKKNKRTLSMGGTDFVRNNYRWRVNQVNRDGSITATEVTRGVTRTLPAWYVNSGWVRLGYAHTEASVQGMTVGSAAKVGTAHAVFTDATNRNQLYTSLSRATDRTISYGVIPGTGDSHEVTTPAAVNPDTVIEMFTAAVGRDGSDRSATTTQRETADPAFRLGAPGNAALAYTHAVVTGSVALVGEQRMQRIADTVEVLVPGVTAAPAWETLKGHLATIAANGDDPVRRLAHAAAGRELKTAVDKAAVLDFRLDKTGNHSLGAGPLPYLPAMPAALLNQPTWNTYLPARAALVAELAQQVRDRAFGWTLDDAPAWAVPYLPDLNLVADLAVWRAAHAVPDTDLRPAGPRPLRLAERTWHTAFTDRAVQVAGDPAAGAHRWQQLLTEQHQLNVAEDDWFPVLAARLTLAEAAGLDVPALLAAAINDQEALPAQVPAKALWWRLEPHLGSLTADHALPASGHRLRPVWAAELEENLGELDAQRVMSDRLWPSIVTHVDRAIRQGQSATLILPAAAGLFASARSTVETHEMATVLLWQIATLTDPEPPDPDLEPAYPDPEQDDLLVPAGAHQLLDAAYAGGGRRSTTRIAPPPDRALPDVDPFDADKYAAAAALIDAAYADLDLTDLVEPADEEADVDAGMREPQDEPPADLYDAVPAPPRRWTSPQPPTEPVNVLDPDTAPVPELPDPQRAAVFARLYAANTAALQYYRDQAPTSWVPDYITDRGLDPDLFGYAPNKYTALSDHLRQAGYTDTELVAAGLAKHSARGQIIDRFRDRAVLPITTEDGQVAAFIGRINPAHVDRGDYTTAKYLNGPTTDIFTKGDLPYGLNPASAQAIRGGADIVLVEGPMDAEAVNTAASAASRNLVAIAPNGTALTAGHLAALNRIAPLADRTVIEAFDSDTAGRAAADKAHTLLAGMHIHAAVTVTGLTGKDPAQMLTDTGPAALLAAVDQRRPLTDATLDRIIDQYDTADGTVESRYHAMAAAVPVIAALPRDQIIDQTIRVAAAVPWDTDRAIDWVAQHIPEQPAPATPPAPHPTTATADDLGLPPLPVLSTDRTPLAPPETAAGSLLTRTRTTTDIDDTAVGAPAQPAALDTDPRWNEVTDLDTAAGAEPVDVHLAASAPPKHQIQQDEDAPSLTAPDRRRVQAPADITVQAEDPQTPETTVVAALETVDPEAAELAQQPSRDVDEEVAVAADAAQPDAPEPGPLDDLPDEVLEEEARQLAATHAAVTEVVDNAVDYLQHLEVQVAADDGPEMTRVQTRHTENERRLAAMKEALDASNATDAAKDQTTKLGIQVMEIEDDLRDVRGAFAGRRRTELQQRLDQTKTAYEQQRAQMMEQARRSHELTAKLGTVAQQRDALALRNADTYRERLAADLEQARQQDLQSVQAAKDWALKSQHRLANTTQQLAEVNTEQTRRAEHPDPEAELRRQELHQQIQDEEAQAAGWGHTSTFDHDLDIPAAPDRSIDR